MPAYLTGKTQKDGKWLYSFKCTCPGQPGLEPVVTVVLPEDDEIKAYEQANDQCINDCSPG